MCHADIAIRHADIAIRHADIGICYADCLLAISQHNLHDIHLLLCVQC